MRLSMHGTSTPTGTHLAGSGAIARSDRTVAGHYAAKNPARGFITGNLAAFAWARVRAENADGDAMTRAPINDNIPTKQMSHAQRISARVLRHTILSNKEFLAYVSNFSCDVRLDDDGEPAVYVYIDTARDFDRGVQYSINRAIHASLSAHGIGANDAMPFYPVVFYRRQQTQQ